MNGNKEDNLEVDYRSISDNVVQEDTFLETKQVDVEVNKGQTKVLVLRTVVPIVIREKRLDDI